jgi:hypothetical protein
MATLTPSPKTSFYNPTNKTFDTFCKTCLGLEDSWESCDDKYDCATSCYVCGALAVKEKGRWRDFSVWCKHIIHCYSTYCLPSAQPQCDECDGVLQPHPYLSRGPSTVTLAQEKTNELLMAERDSYKVWLADFNNNNDTKKEDTCYCLNRANMIKAARLQDAINVINDKLE